ncbi:MAG TPA: hypothetical protein VFT22_27315 [Kofleriaceae bacterium]|nr:hypothetical protein [Kofleriaceae bacterium]
MRWVFRGTGGFLGRIESETRIAFWADEPTEHGFDPARLIAVDLARTPSAAALGEIPFDAVEVDDCYSGPGGDVRGTTLGPCWPELPLTGAVYLEQRFRDRLPAELRPALPPRFMTGRPHEYTTVLYWPGTGDPRAGKRYAGHHAELLEERGSLARVAVYPPGTSESANAVARPMWIDLASAEQTDGGPHSLTEIGLGRGVTRGALYLISSDLVLTRTNHRKQVDHDQEHE